MIGLSGGDVALHAVLRCLLQAGDFKGRLPGPLVVQSVDQWRGIGFDGPAFRRVFTDEGDAAVGAQCFGDRGFQGFGLCEAAQFKALRSPIRRLRGRVPVVCRRVEVQRRGAAGGEHQDRALALLVGEPKREVGIGAEEGREVVELVEPRVAGRNDHRIETAGLQGIGPL